MDTITNNLVEHWDRVKDMSDDAKATFVSCLSPSHYETILRLRPEIELVRKSGK